MASGGVVMAEVVGDVVGDVVAVALCKVVPSRTRNQRRDQCLVSGGAISNAHAPANETVPTIKTATLNAVLKAVRIMSARERVDQCAIRCARHYRCLGGVVDDMEHQVLSTLR